MWKKKRGKIFMPKQTSLVCQYLENISREALESYQDIIRSYVGRRQGIYALYKGNRLYYVGLARNLRSRLRQHLKDRHGESWDRFSVYLTIGDSHMKELESLILRIVKTTGNKQKGKFSKAENLRRKLASDIRANFSERLVSIIGVVSSKKLPEKKIGKIESKITGRRPALADYVKESFVLRTRFKGKILEARVRKNGTVSFGGKIFTSPSLAAAVACKRATENGWKFWKYERAPGDWVKLDELRK
jgi:hypothetical protein